MIAEVLVVVSILASGVFTLRTLGMKYSWLVLPLGFISGTVLVTLAVFLQAIIGLALPPIVSILLIVLIPFTVGLYRLGSGILKIDNPGKALAILLGLTVLIVIFYVSNFVRFHSDSLNFLMIGSLLFDGDYISIPSYAIQTRFSSVSAIHTFGNFSGDFYLRSFTPLLSISLLSSLVWLVGEGVKKSTSQAKTNVFAITAVLLLVSSHAFIFHSFYLNGHLLTAVYFLVGAGSGWLAAQQNRSVPTNILFVLQALTAAGLVLTRVEGFLYAAMILLPTIFLRKTPTRYGVALTAALGATIILQQGVKFSLLDNPGGSALRHMVPLTILGVLIMLSSLLVPLKDKVKKSDYLLWLTEAGLWVVLVVLFARKPDILITSVDSTIQNISVIPHPWGWSLILLTTALTGALLLYRFKNQIFLRFPITTFIPIVLIIAYLREGAYRVASADSLNRMLIHIVPLTVLYVILAASIGMVRVNRNDNVSLKKYASKIG